MPLHMIFLLQSVGLFWYETHCLRTEPCHKRLHGYIQQKDK